MSLPLPLLAVLLAADPATPALDCVERRCVLPEGLPPSPTRAEPDVGPPPILGRSAPTAALKPIDRPENRCCAPRQSLTLDEPVVVTGVKPEPGVVFIDDGTESARRALEALLQDSRGGTLVSRPTGITARAPGVYVVKSSAAVVFDPTRTLGRAQASLARCALPDGAPLVVSGRVHLDGKGFVAGRSDETAPDRVRARDCVVRAVTKASAPLVERAGGPGVIDVVAVVPAVDAAPPAPPAPDRKRGTGAADAPDDVR